MAWAIASPMKFRTSLERRTTLAFAAFGALVSLTLAVGVHFAVGDMEKRLVLQALEAELQDYVSRRERNPHSPPPSTATVRGYVAPSERFAQAIPPQLLSLSPGRHSLMIGERRFRAAIEDRGGSRFYLLHDESQALQRMRLLSGILAGGVVVMTLLSAMLGGRLAHRVLSPVRQLAHKVHDAAPDVPANLAADYARDEVGELAAAFDRYASRLHNFIERERAFTADLSHELRTPLSVIGGAAEVLQYDASLSPAARERVERIARACRDMAELTPALLALARESAAPSRECAMQDLVTRAVDNNRHLLAGRPVTLAVDVQAVSIAAEPALLRVVVENLIRNAFSYTERGHVAIHLDEHALVVEDTGSGISPEESDRIFETFYASASGTGIGLSLVKRICERYGWRIEFDSQPGQGSVFRLRFRDDRQEPEGTEYPVNLRA
jgi:signal transduction histidine kinase